MVSEERWEDGDEEFGESLDGSYSSSDESLYEMRSDFPAASELDSCDDVYEDNSVLDLKSDKSRKVELSGGVIIRVITLRNTSYQEEPEEVLGGSLHKNTCPHPGVVFAGMCVACGKNLGDEFGVGLEYIHKMNGWNDSSYEAEQTSPRCKKRKLKATTHIESLPDDIIFNILVHFPAQDIYDSLRLVCRKWYKMTQTRNFVHSHLQRSIPGLLSVWKYATPPLCKRTFMTMQNGRTEISRLSYGKVLSSCNGLLLESSENFVEPYITNPTYITNPPYITNPVTRQRFALPQLPLVSDEEIYNESFAIAYAASSGAYKVVRASHYNDNNLRCISIMTVGVDTSWGRRVSTQHLSADKKWLLNTGPLTTQGFVHWAHYGCSDCVLTMNVESEIITQIPGPCLCPDGKILWCCYLPMGSYLSLLIGERSSWEVWKMKPETGEWTKMPSIDIPRKLSEYLSLSDSSDLSVFSDMFRPVGWSNSQEMLFFSVLNNPSQIIAAYNVRTREIGSFYELDSIENLFVEHRSSLVWLD